MMEPNRGETDRNFARLFKKAHSHFTIDDLRKVLIPATLDAAGRVSRIDLDGNGTARPSAMSEKSVSQLRAIIAAAPAQIPANPSPGDYQRKANAREATDELFLRSLRDNPITLVPGAVFQDIQTGTGRRLPPERD